MVREPVTPDATPYLIVVGVDYSEVSGSALSEAARQASQHAASELHVLGVESLTLARPRRLIGTSLGAPSTDTDAPLARLREWLATQPLGLAEDQGATSRRIVLHAPWEARGEHVHRLAEALDADLVVVGVNSSNGWAEQVAAASDRSVLVVRTKPAGV